MADPRKETKRERREATRQRRLEELRRRERKAKTRRMLLIGVAALAIAGLVGGILAARAASNRNKERLRAAAAAGGCEPVKALASEGQEHKPPYQYKTNPPSSGNHANATANTGILTPAPPDENLVHNMEHGHVIFWYKPELEASLITGLQDIVKKDPTRLIMVPRSNMDPTLAFTSWAHLQSCPAPKQATLATAEVFADTHKAKGPEGDGDTPGVPAGI